jgi:hypothetical protein
MSVQWSGELIIRANKSCGEDDLAEGSLLKVLSSARALTATREMRGVMLRVEIFLCTVFPPRY